MARHRSQRGSSLVLLLGIMAVLAILASSLIVVLANAQRNTARERSQSKSFHVAEAALDGAMANISQNWPSATPVPFPTAAFQNEFKSTPSPSSTSTPQPENPGPTGADVPDVSVTYFDDSDTNHDGKINAQDANFDANGNEMLYIVAQAGVLKRASRVQCLVHRSDFEPQIPLATVLWTGGDLLNNSAGGGTLEKVSVLDLGPLSNGTVAADVGGKIIPREDYDAGLINLTSVNTQFTDGPPYHDNPRRSLEDVYPSSDRDAAVHFAKLVGRYFDENNAGPDGSPLQAALNSPPSVYGGPGLAGLTVVHESTAGAETLQLGSVTDPRIPRTLNSEAAPGLLLLSGVNLEIGGSQSYWGLICVESGAMKFSHGTPAIYGALFSTSTVEFRGTPNIYYKYWVLAGIAGRSWPSAVTMVPNTWRELQPK